MTKKSAEHDLLRRSLDSVLVESSKGNDCPGYHEAFDNFVWCLSVANRRDLDSVFDYLMYGDRYWQWPISVLAIFGRVYAASLQHTDPGKAVEVVERFLFPNTDQLEWRNLVGTLGLTKIRMK